MWNSCISKCYKAVIRQISPRCLGSACYWLGRENANILMDWFKKCQVICNTSRKSSDCIYKEYKWELEWIAKIGRGNKDSVILVRLVIGILQSSQKHLLLSRTSGCTTAMKSFPIFPVCSLWTGCFPSCFLILLLSSIHVLLFSLLLFDITGNIALITATYQILKSETRAYFHSFYPVFSVTGFWKTAEDLVRQHGSDVYRIRHTMLVEQLFQKWEK